MSKKEAEEQAVQSAKSATAAAGKLSGLSGRDLFTFNPDMLGADEYDDEDGEGDDDEWDLDALRAKTERAREERELERCVPSFLPLSLAPPSPPPLPLALVELTRALSPCSIRVLEGGVGSLSVSEPPAA